MISRDIGVIPRDIGDKPRDLLLRYIALVWAVGEGRGATVQSPFSSYTFLKECLKSLEI